MSVSTYSIIRGNTVAEGLIDDSGYSCMWKAAHPQQPLAETEVLHDLDRTHQIDEEVGQLVLSRPVNWLVNLHYGPLLACNCTLLGCLERVQSWVYMYMYAGQCRYPPIVCIGTFVHVTRVQGFSPPLSLVVVGMLTTCMLDVDPFCSPTFLSSDVATSQLMNGQWAVSQFIIAHWHSYLPA